MNAKLRKEIRDWALIALLCLVAWHAPGAWKSFQDWRASQGVWIEVDMEGRVA